MDHDHSSNLRDKIKADIREAELGIELLEQAKSTGPKYYTDPDEFNKGIDDLIKNPQDQLADLEDFL